jgi:hypothetical protein
MTLRVFPQMKRLLCFLQIVGQNDCPIAFFYLLLLAELG